MAAGVVRVLEHSALVYRRQWRGTLFSTFLTPVLFLLAMGIGLGAYVDRAGSAELGGVSYLAFLAPGLLAAQAMQTASFATTYPILASIQWLKTFDGMLNTPLRVRDILLGEVGWIALRLTMVASVFLLVIFLFGAVASPLAVFAVPVAVLTGLAFATPIAAFTATQRKDSGFAAIFRFVITPLFLFSGTFFPIQQLPDFMEPVAYVTPIYHGVALARDLTLGRAELISGLIHLAVL
nr:ABC transporter permease [Chloroflexota bacterium]